MKTPREILLERHKSAEGKLDSIRTEVLRNELPRSQEVSRQSTTFFSQLWAQLILPSRGIWAGMATLWIVVFALHLVTTGEKTVSYASARTAKVTPEVQMALRTQQQLFAELINGKPTPVPPNRRFIPSPRSENRPILHFA